MNKKLNNKGFTLIEVVLVLAIGGLIFLLAFLAFQQVSRNRRDTQRRSDVARMAAVFNDVKSNSGTGVAPDHAAWKAAVLATPGLKAPGDVNYIFPSGDTAYATSQPTTLDQDTVRLVSASNVYSVCVGLDGGGRVACRNVE